MDQDFITVPVFRFEQNSQVMFLGAMLSTDIIKISEIDVRDETKNPTGYQRYREEARCRRIAEYINLPTSSLPGSILLNLRGSSTFQKISDTQHYGNLRIPKKLGAAWIVDGQHRIGGFVYSEKEFFLPVVFFENLNKRLEMINFSIINDTQKGVNTSLTLSLLGEIRDGIEDWKIRAHDIAFEMNHTPDSPWYERINMTGARGMHRPVNLASFANALKTLLKQHSFFHTLQLSEQVILIKRFWNSTRSIFPEAWCEPQKYILLKTLGVYSMMNVAGRAFDLCASNNGDFSEENFLRILKPLTGFDWHRDTSPFNALGGLKGCKEASKRLIERLPKISVIITN